MMTDRATQQYNYTDRVTKVYLITEGELISIRRGAITTVFFGVAVGGIFGIGIGTGLANANFVMALSFVISGVPLFFLMVFLLSQIDNQLYRIETESAPEKDAQ